MEQPIIQAGTSGFILDVEIHRPDGSIVQNLDEATDITFVFLAPDKTPFERTGIVVGIGEVIPRFRYISTALDFVQPGLYSFQVHFALEGWIGPTQVMYLQSNANLPREP